MVGRRIQEITVIQWRVVGYRTVVKYVDGTWLSFTISEAQYAALSLVVQRVVGRGSGRVLPMATHLGWVWRRGGDKNA